MPTESMVDIGKVESGQSARMGASIGRTSSARSCDRRERSKSFPDVVGTDVPRDAVHQTSEAHAAANRGAQRSRLEGPKRSKLTLEEEWSTIRREYGIAEGTKMFVMDGSFPGVRDALLDRGWAEHKEIESMCFDLKWTIKTGDIDFQRLMPSQIVNHFKKNRAVTTKVGLSKSLRALQWFEEVDADSFFPRSYDLDDLEDVHTFVEDFMLVAAQNTVEAFLSEPTSAAVHKAHLGLIACEDFVRHWETDIDLTDDDDGTDEGGGEGEIVLGGAPSRLSAEDWSVVLGEECPIAAVRFVVGGEVAETCSQAVTNKASSLASFLQGLRACGVLESKGAGGLGTRGKGSRWRLDDEVAAGTSHSSTLDGAAFRTHAEAVLGKVRQMQGPQATLNGRQNLWIIKPAGKSRGRGIQVKGSLVEILAFVTDTRGLNGHSTERWIVQKYIEDPLLIQGRKFDIRQWVLVSDWNPLTVWMYDQCYLRFALAKYTTDNLGDKYAHLCNNCVQSTAPDFEQRRASRFRSCPPPTSRVPLSHFLPPPPVP